MCRQEGRVFQAKETAGVNVLGQGQGVIFKKPIAVRKEVNGRRCDQRCWWGPDYVGPFRL